MSRRARLTGSVIAVDESGLAHFFGVGEVVPKWALKDVPKGLLDSQEDEETVEDETPAPSAPSAPPAPENDGSDGSDGGDGDDDLLGDDTPAEPVEKPAGNGTLEDWQAYARFKGASAEDLEGKNRNEIRAAYGDA